MILASADETDDENEFDDNASGPDEDLIDQNMSGDDEEEEAQEEEIFEDRLDDLLLYERARITVGESLLAILSLFLRHTLTGACLTDILKLVELPGTEFIWPFFFTINELPINKRMKKENMILGGLWFGPKKPFPALFLKPISEDLIELKNGVNFELPSLDKSNDTLKQLYVATHPNSVWMLAPKKKGMISQLKQYIRMRLHME
nr:PREDICTED: uncharacterized protein LOC105272167 [Fopius arisanus]